MPEQIRRRTQAPARAAAHWSDELLEYKRLQADPLADMVIATILEAGLQAEINKVFAILVQNSSFHPDSFKNLPAPVHAAISHYFAATSTLPDWADSRKLAAGAKVFSLYGPEIALLLNVKSLPMCYSCWRGAHVLYQTGRLSERSGSLHPLARRLMETSQMVMNVLAPGSMSPGGSGIVTIQKVRLIHAAIRYFIKHTPAAPWDLRTYGEPINQEDLAGTLMSFSSLVLKGLKQLSISLSAAETAGYMHSWRVVGYLLGIHEDLLPHTYKEGWALGTTILRRQAAASQEGKELTQAAIDFLKYVVPGNLFDDVPEYFIWYFMQDVSKATGKDLAQLLGVQPAHSLKGRLLLKVTRLLLGELDSLDNRSKLVQQLSAHFNKEMLRGFMRYYNEGKQVHFYIPPSLQQDWRL